ncbi:unnamed protein product [Penicillium olsonii]|uniref:Uncharacterized protein n=1 Tax=Penicillium olsonii TaxID=99116 RepID=A0A9W4MN88_PENOL|nr:unnamed protein product [Penicillium olsonii]CAG7934258.1 unnamed protein product [Penicillium olsonii]CAG7941950.1 unnamed protein product [Penicillium olsonii]CAG7969927.1 unnamed protein product [Penicillium olsonii]CAG7973532.1 unnamed protein product [Penicillium olsonii]
MKPVVSALNAWSCVVISLFAIVILSVLGSLFGSNNHSFTGSDGEPEDGPAVAASIYTAVIVYIVRPSPSRDLTGSTFAPMTKSVADSSSSSPTGFLLLLRFPGLPSHARQQGRRYILELNAMIYLRSL